MNNEIIDLPFFKYIFEISIKGVLDLDEEGNIKAANFASEYLFEYNEGEMRLKHILDLIPKDNKLFQKILIKKVSSSRTSIEFIGLKRNNPITSRTCLELLGDVMNGISVQKNIECINVIRSVYGILYKN